MGLRKTEPRGKKEEEIYPLFQALKSSDSNDLEALLGNSIEVNVADSGLCTPLHWAAFLNKLEAVKVLLHHGANANSLSSSKRSPLHEACSEGGLQLVELLCRHGADVTASDYSDRLPIHLAAINDKRDVLDYLISRGSPLSLRAVPLRATPLHESLSFGHARVAERLILAGCDVTAEDKEGKDALDYTLRNTEGLDLSKLLWLLTAAGCRLKTRHLESARRFHSEEFDLLSWLDEGVKNPQTLQELARVAIRNVISHRQVGRDILPSMNSLPLPSLMIKYLRLGLC